MTRAASNVRSTAWAGYAACAWALSFAAVHFCWGGGGTAGIDTIGSTVTDLAGNPWFLAIGLWGVGLVFVVLGLIALALVWSGGKRISGSTVLIGAVSLGYAGMALLVLLVLTTQEIGLVVVGYDVCVLDVASALLLVVPPAEGGDRRARWRPGLLLHWLPVAFQHSGIREET